MRIFRIIPVLALLIAGCNESSSPAAEAPVVNAIPVKIARVERQTHPDPVRGTGILAGKEEILLSFKIGGILDRIIVEEGDRVKKGRLLAQLSQDEIRAQVTQARSALEKTQRDLDRADRLHRDRVVTLEQLQNATTAVEVAEANLTIAEFNQRHATIYAPSNGVILKRFVDRRELLSPGDPVLVMSSASRHQVLRLGVTDQEIVRLQRGDSAHVAFDAYPGETFRALVSEIAEQSVPHTGTYEVELAIANDQARILKTGFIGSAVIFPSISQAFYRIPLDALVEGDRNTAVVFVPDAERRTAQRVAVRPYHIGNKYFTVLEEHAPPLEEVITDGAPYLSENAEIVVQQ